MLFSYFIKVDDNVANFACYLNNVKATRNIKITRKDGNVIYLYSHFDLIFCRKLERTDKKNEIVTR